MYMICQREWCCAAVILKLTVCAVTIMVGLCVSQSEIWMKTLLFSLCVIVDLKYHMRI